MAFSSITFLFAFLPLSLFFYFLIPEGLRVVRNFILLLVSLLFYAWGGLRLLPVLLFSCIFNWVAAWFVPGRRVVLIPTICVNIVLLGWFKYSGFFAENLNSLGMNLTIPDIILPAGISFFTFQALGYVIDVYRGDILPERNPLRVILFMTFFPQLLQGPIWRYASFLADISDRDESLNQVASGALRFCFGLSKKILLADALGNIANAAFSSGERLTTGFAWAGAIAYTLQIYFDFSGYSDMAVGLGSLFGFSLPENFNYPYAAKSITDFWRRWHMSLSGWFRDYVYIPSGGSRCPAGRQIANLLLVWFLTGFWHGAAWNFILWGLYYAVILIGERFIWGKILDHLPVIRNIYTLFIVIIGWVLFRAENGTQIIHMLSAMFSAAPGGLISSECLYYLKEYIWEWSIALLAIFPVKKLLQKLSDSGWSVVSWIFSLCARLLALVLLLLSVMQILHSGVQSFLYFQF